MWDQGFVIMICFKLVVNVRILRKLHKNQTLDEKKILWQCNSMQGNFENDMMIGYVFIMQWCLVEVTQLTTITDSHKNQELLMHVTKLPHNLKNMQKQNNFPKYFHK